MSLRQSHPSIICNQGAMEELWRRQIQSLVKQQLPGGGFEQIFATNNFGDAHGGIVHNNGKLIGRQTIMTPNDEITKVAACDEFVRPRATINKRDRFVISD